MNFGDKANAYASFSMFQCVFPWGPRFIEIPEYRLGTVYFIQNLKFQILLILPLFFFQMASWYNAAYQGVCMYVCVCVL